MKTGLPITKTVSAWNQQVELKFTGFFSGLAKALTTGSGGLKAFFATISAVGSAVDFKADPRQTGWLLIYRSLLQALGELVQENESALLAEPRNERAMRYLLGDPPDDPDALLVLLDRQLEASKVRIDKKFFQNPQGLPVLNEVKAFFIEWLKAFGLSEGKAAAISERLPSYFLYALNDQWRTRLKEYLVLKEFFDTPFTTATNEETSWNNYFAWLQRQVDQPVFDETFSLRQIYVPLRACYEPHKQHSNTDKRPQIVQLDKELQTWLEVTEPDDSVLVISGGPGSGKSSFAKMFAAEQAALNKRRVLLIPLHLFEPEGDLLEALNRFVGYDELLPPNPLLSKSFTKQALLIFDGLDELAMQGRMAAEVAQNFVAEILRKAYQFNLHSSRLKIMITGRELTVQAAASSFRRPRQILHLVPYYVPIDERSKYGDVENLLSEDQRVIWWQSYCRLSGSDPSCIASVLGNEILRDITSQPLLNYLIALSVGRGELDLTEETNLNSVYRDLLTAVYQRSWTGYQHPAMSGVTEDQFIRLLEEIAVSTWHGDGRTTTLKEVEAHCEQSGLVGVLNEFGEDVTAGVSRLLLAFYFRRAGNRTSGEQTFEFTHKSFAEYLTSRRIVRTVEALNNEILRFRTYSYSGWDERTALLNWIKLSGPVAFDFYLFNFVEREIFLRESADTAAWQKTVSELISFVLRNGLPIDHLIPRPSFRSEIIQSANAEEALLAVLQCCSNHTESVSEFKWPSPDTLKSWLTHLRAGKGTSGLRLVLACLSRLRIVDCILSNVNLRDANLERSVLTDADMRNAILRGANLAEVDFTKADLSGADLSNANLEGATLREAMLVGAKLSGANLLGANLDGANLRESNLTGALLTEASLIGGDLRRANLNGTILNRARLRGSNLMHSTLTKSNLDHADLSWASLVRANLSESDLTETNLHGSDLKEADLTRAFLKNTNLENAYLLRTDMRSAYLIGVNLRGTNPPSNFLLT